MSIDPIAEMSKCIKCLKEEDDIDTQRDGEKRDIIRLWNKMHIVTDPNKQTANVTDDLDDAEPNDRFKQSRWLVRARRQVGEEKLLFRWREFALMLPAFPNAIDTIEEVKRQNGKRGLPKKHEAIGKIPIREHTLPKIHK